MTGARKWLLGTVGFFAVLALVVVVAVELQPPMKSDEDVIRERLKTETLWEATPSNLVNDYRSSEIRGDKNWKGKLVRLTATVDSIRRTHDGTNTPVAIVHTLHADVNPDYVACLLDGEYDLPIGPKVVLRCIVGGLQQGVPTLGVCRPE